MNELCISRVEERLESKHSTSEKSTCSNDISVFITKYCWNLKLLKNCLKFSVGIVKSDTIINKGIIVFQVR